ncbi:MAG: transcriptional repressor [Ruminococcaceae bacterium]|nr:transcriptional repressor [Oscillospiraceae bacterium]
MKNSKQRTLILDTIKNNPIHPTAKEVYNQAREKCPNISLGTVYRNLSALTEMGLIKHIAVSDGCDRYDGRLDRHFHLICSGCGKVKDVELEKYFALEKYAEEQTDYKVDEIDIVMKGYCPECWVMKNKPCE